MNAPRHQSSATAKSNHRGCAVTNDFGTLRQGVLALSSASLFAIIAVLPLRSQAADGYKSPVVAMPCVTKESAAPRVAIYTRSMGLFSDGKPKVIIALWDDGRIAWSDDTIKGGPPYRVGKFELARLRKLLDDFEKKGVFRDNSLSQARYGPDSSYTAIAVVEGKRRLYMSSWHELAEHHSKTVVATSDGLTSLEGRDRAKVLAAEPESYRNYRQTWTDLKKALIALIPHEGEKSELHFEVRRLSPTQATAESRTSKLMIMPSSSQTEPPMLKHNYADVNGIRLHYVSAGGPKKPLVLFVHGFPEFWYEWKNQLAEFGRDHYAVAVDMRGYNLSTKPEKVEDYEVRHLVEDLRALAAKLTKRKFVLVGHDWGGAVAWAFAMKHPDLLEKLVIINAPHPGVFMRELKENPEQQKASQYMLLFRSPIAEATLSANNYAALVNAILGEGLKQGYFTEEDKKAYLEAWSQPGALTGGLNYYRAAKVGPPTAADSAVGTFDVEAAAMTVKVSTLVIWGEKDTALLTGNLNGLDKFVPALSIKRISDGSHWVIHEKPALINAMIREFIGARARGKR